MEEDLKKRCKALETTIHLQKQYTGATINRAKQIIEGLLDAFPNSYSDVVKDKLDEARQFLTETEMVLNYFL
jgi:outer membrane protein assembly factor BamD (BamD/ComL family)